MELAKIIGVGLVTAVTALVLRNTKPELAFAVSIAGGVILLMLALDSFTSSFHVFTEIAEKTGIDNSLLKIILKIVAIGWLVEFAAGIVEDFGSKNIADKMVLAGKLVIFTVAVPIVRSLISLIGNVLELV